MVFEARTRNLAMQDRQLMAQHENLGILGPASATAQQQQVDHESDETVETGHALILAAVEARRSGRAQKPRSTHPTGFRHPQVVGRPREDTLRHRNLRHYQTRSSDHL